MDIFSVLDQIARQQLCAASCSRGSASKPPEGLLEATFVWWLANRLRGTCRNESLLLLANDYGGAPHGEWLPLALPLVRFSY